MSDDPTLAFILGGSPDPKESGEFPAFKNADDDGGQREAERAAMRRFKRLVRSEDSGEDEMSDAFRHAMTIFRKG